MIVVKCWRKYVGKGLIKHHTYKGVFLFGIIPLYIVRDTTTY